LVSTVFSDSLPSFEHPLCLKHILVVFSGTWVHNMAKRCRACGRLLFFGQIRQ
jgi:hypothetical protein